MMLNIRGIPPNEIILSPKLLKKLSPSIQNMNIYQMLSGVGFAFTNDKRQFHLRKYFAFLREYGAKSPHFSLISGLRMA